MTLTDKDYKLAAEIYGGSGGGPRGMRRAFTYLLQLRTTKAEQEKDRARYERRKAEAAR